MGSLDGRRMSALCLLALLASPNAVARTECTVVDLMPTFWQSIQGTDAPARLRATLVEAHPDLYNHDFVDVPAAVEWESIVLQDRSYVQSRASEVRAVESYLSANVPNLMTQFQEAFSDFKCDFPFYIAPSFGRMDAAAAFVNGQNRIIFAPDVIPRFHELPDLKILIDHETFHVFHHEVTNAYGASSEAEPTILEALWSEGLATFVSWRMNPGASLDKALLQPGIPEAANRHLASIAKDLLAHLDEKDSASFHRYFVAGKQREGDPPRAGYYVGALIAQKLAARHTLQQLAHLNGPGLRWMVADSLQELASAR